MALTGATGFFLDSETQAAPAEAPVSTHSENAYFQAMPSSQESRLRLGITFIVVFQRIHDCQMYDRFSAGWAHRKIAGSSILDWSVKLLFVCSRSMKNTQQIGSKVKNTKLILKLMKWPPLHISLLNFIDCFNIQYSDSNYSRLQNKLYTTVTLSINLTRVAYVSITSSAVS